MWAVSAAGAAVSSASTAAAAASRKLITVSIIGTAGRGEDAKSMSRFVYDTMLSTARHVILNDWKLDPSRVQLVSGGAAWSDHIVIQLFLEGMSYVPGEGKECPVFPEPIIHFPCEFDMKRMEAAGSTARSVNKLHREFSAATGRNSLSEIASAIHMGAVLTTSTGFQERNALVAQSEYLMAFTWSIDHEPKPGGGTASTWKMSTARVKEHIPIGRMMKRVTVCKRPYTTVERPQVANSSAAAAGGSAASDRPLKRHAVRTPQHTWETPFATAAMARHEMVRSVLSEFVDPTPEQLERKPDSVLAIGRLCADYDGYRYGLSPEQRRILQSELAGNSVFITGPAGTGKSTLLNQTIECLKHRYESEPTALVVTASTGTAGTIIKGPTIHSWSGCGYFNKPVEDIIKDVLITWPGIGTRIRKAIVLIIDEIPMISAEQFSILSEVLSSVRGNDSPFGGLQVIAAGDFLQLPPVSPSKPCQFAFEAPEWDRLFSPEHHYHMTTVHRQNAKPMVRALNKMRLGICDNEVLRYFEPAIGRTLQPHNGIIPTRLYAKRKDVRQENERELAALPGEVMCASKAIDTGTDADKSFQAPAFLYLKVGAQVMFLYNDTMMGLVNGSRGVVTGFEPEPSRLPFASKRLFPIVRFMNGSQMRCGLHTFTVEEGGKVVSSRVQIPLMLAWALTIHKSQGQTLDYVRVEIGGVFEAAMTYVAYSRGTCIDQVSGDMLLPMLVRANPAAIAWYSRRFGPKYGYPNPRVSGGSASAAAASSS